ncbi:MAG TPA: hypothetical protein VHR88_02520 [Solirubrobacteraceae bacterium]|nr:hypothetical protein [Solirubrobacteraceae bacterium]
MDCGQRARGEPDLSSIRRSYRDLESEQQQLLQTKQIDAERTAGDWLRLLAPLAGYDEQADRLRSRLGGWMLGIGIVGFILAIIAVAISPIAGAAVAVVVIVALLVMYPNYRFTKKMDVNRTPLQFVTGVAPILREDCGDDGALHLRLDMRGPTLNEKQTGKSQPYSRGRYYKIVDTYYMDPWCAGGAAFVDGTQVQWIAIDYVRSMRKTKRNPRGKIKTKTKSKKKTNIDVTVTFPDKLYDNANGTAGPDRQLRKQKIKDDEAKTVIRLRRTIKSPSDSTPLDPRHLIDLIAASYERVKPTRRKKLAG